MLLEELFWGPSLGNATSGWSSLTQRLEYRILNNHQVLSSVRNKVCSRGLFRVLHWAVKIRDARRRRNGLHPGRSAFTISSEGSEAKCFPKNFSRSLVAHPHLGMGAVVATASIPGPQGPSNLLRRSSRSGEVGRKYRTVMGRKRRTVVGRKHRPVVRRKHQLW